MITSRLEVNRLGIGRRERGNWERRRHEKRMVKNGERRENQFRVITVYSPNDNPITASLKQYQG